jgi:hypothetical protein
MRFTPIAAAAALVTGGVVGGVLATRGGDRAPTASAPPPAASARTIIARPSTTIASDRTRVAIRCRSRGARIAHTLGRAAEPRERRPARRRAVRAADGPPGLR